IFCASSTIDRRSRTCGDSLAWHASRSRRRIFETSHDRRAKGDRKRTFMNEIKAPEALPKRVFLAGSIEMGTAENWQERVVRELATMPNLNLTILNPRRENWDASWVQSISNPQFKEQVEWEIAAQEMADMIFMYFAPETKAPITLL